MKRVLCMCLCLLVCGALWSQVTIKGRMYDLQNHESLAGAYVWVNQLNNGVVSDIDGNYQMQLPEGVYTFTISYVGYQTRTDTLRLYKSNRHDFYLSPQDKQLTEVVVQSKGFEQRLSSASMSCETLEIGEIRRLPAFMGEVDVIKAMQLLPGVQSMSEGSSSFSVRGGAPDENLILLDGAPVYNASHLMGFFSVFNNDVVRQATLYKGDIPATRGGRLSSVLEIDTKEGDYEKFKGEGGLGLISSRLLLEGPLVKNRLSAFVAGRVFYAGLFLPLASNNPIASKSRLTFYDLNAKLSAKLTNKQRLSLSGYWGSDYFALSGTGVFAYSNKAATLHHNALLSPSWSVSTMFTGSWYDYQGEGTLSGLKGTWVSDINDYAVQHEYSYDVDAHNHLRFGLSSSYKIMHSGDVKVKQDGIDTNMKVSIPPSNNLESAVYVSNKQNYGAWSMDYGLRVSMFNHFKPTPSHTYCSLEPRAAVAWRFVPAMSLKAGYARTVQYLHLIQTTTAGSPLDVWRASNATVKPETCNQFSLGYVYSFWHDRLQLTAETYYKLLNNVVDFKDFAQIILNEQIDNEIVSGKGRAYGVELMLRKEKGSVTGWVSYTYARSLRTVEGINNGVEYRSASDRPHSVNIVVNYQINKLIELGASWVYATGQPFSAPEGRMELMDFGYPQVIPLYSGRNQYRMPDYHRLDLSVNFDFNRGVVKRYNHSLNISFYNVYCRHNAWMIRFDTNEETHRQEASLTYLFSIVPSLTYNFSF